MVANKNMRRFFEMIWRFIYYGYKMRNSYDWDFGYAEEVLLLKLERLKYHMDNDEFHMNIVDLKKEMSETTNDFEKELYKQQIKSHKALNCVIPLLKRDRDPTYYFNLLRADRFVGNFTEEDPLGLKQSVNQNLVESAKRQEKMRKRDKRLLYTLIIEYSDGWWT